MELKFENGNEIKNYGGVDSFEDLEVYKLAQRLRNKVYELTEALPPEEKYNLVYDLFRMSWVPIARKMAMPSSNSKIKRYFIVTEPSQRFLVP